MRITGTACTKEGAKKDKEAAAIRAAKKLYAAKSPVLTAREAERKEEGGGWEERRCRRGGCGPISCDWQRGEGGKKSFGYIT